MIQKTDTHGNESSDQLQQFKDLARDLGCDEYETKFDGALKKLAESAPLPKHEPKKRYPPKCPSENILSH